MTKLIDIQWQPTDRQLRQFGLIALVALPLAGGLWGRGAAGVIAGTAALGAACAAAGLLRPRWLKPLFVGLSIVAAPVGLVVGELSMALIFFGVFLPIALVFRVLRRDALGLKMERWQPSFWEAKPPAKGPESYFRQW